jgi:hypothetical protein
MVGGSGLHNNNVGVALIDTGKFSIFLLTYRYYRLPFGDKQKICGISRCEVRKPKFSTETNIID